MNFGLLFEMQRPYEGTDIDWNTLYKETLDQVELADRVGYDRAWFVEHHFLLGFSGSPVSRGNLRSAQPAYEEHPDRLRRVHPPARASGSDRRARGHG